MLAPTHSVFGLFLTLTFLAVFGVKESLHWSIIVCTVLGAIAPDLDMPRSFVGRMFPFISKYLERKYGHRTVTHSLLGWLIATAIFALALAAAFTAVILAQRAAAPPLDFQSLPAFSRPIFSRLRAGQLVISSAWYLRLLSAFAIGYFSHVFLDMCNPRGSQLFWPNKTRDVIPKNVNFRPETGSKAEIPFFLFFCIFLLCALPISKYGVLTSLRWLLATPEATIEEFKTQNTKTYLEFEGILNATKTPIKGTGEILDVKNQRLVILIKNGGGRMENEGKNLYCPQLTKS